MLVFMEGGKPEYPEKNPRSKDEKQQRGAIPATPNTPGARGHGSGATLQNLD